MPDLKVLHAIGAQLARTNNDCPLQVITVDNVPYLVRIEVNHATYPTCAYAEQVLGITLAWHSHADRHEGYVDRILVATVYRDHSPPELK